MRRLRNGSVCALLGALWLLPACGDDGGSPSFDVSNPDTSTPDGAGDVAADTGPDGAGPGTPDGSGGSDGVGGGDGTTGPDGTNGDPDAGGDGTTTGGLKAKVFESDPETDDSELTTVTLTPPTTEDGTLINDFVEIRNCLNEEGGEPMSFQGQEVGRLCNETQKATPNADGDYLHIEPPNLHSDPDDAFAEVMTYYHTNRILDYFDEAHGILPAAAEEGNAVHAIMNVQIYIDQLGGWRPFPNAAYIPGQGFAQFGLEPREQGAMVYGQVQLTDLSYDSSVIYHEYTHTVIGEGKLRATFADQYGLNNLPGAVGEGYADYFSATLREDPVIGSYALAALGGQQSTRDLSANVSCPEDLIGEVHADGEIIGSALWEIRNELGPETADGIIARAISGFTQTTAFDQAGQLILGEAEQVSAEAANAVEQILQDHGVLSCERAQEWDGYTPEDSGGVPIRVPGTQSFQGGAPADGVPGYFQFYVDMPDGKEAVTLRWDAEVRSGFGGGGVGGGGSEAANVQIAVRKGEPVGFGPAGGVTADAVLSPGSVQGSDIGRSVTLAGDCLPADGGRIYLMLLNQGQRQASVNSMERTVRDDTSGAANLRGCTE